MFMLPRHKYSLHAILISIYFFAIIFIGTENNVLLGLNIESSWFQRIIIFELLMFMVQIFISFCSHPRVDVVFGLVFLKFIFLVFTFLLYKGSIRDFLVYGFLQFSFLISVYFYISIWKNFDIEKITRIIIIAAVLVSAEIIITSLITINKYGLMYIKAYMILPMGDSNFIALFLGPLLIYYFVVSENKFINRVLIPVTVVAFLLLMSRGGLFCFFFVLFIAISNKRSKKISNKIIVPLFFLVLLALFFDDSSFAKGLFSSYKNMFDLLKTRDLNKVTSGRVLIYKNYIEGILRKPFLGHGFEFVQSTMGSNAHNFVLSELYSTGIVGTIPYLSVIYVLMKRFKKNKDYNRYIMGVYYGCMYSILHGFFEPGIQGFIAGFSFWLLLGIGTNICRCEFTREVRA